jgi:hypothetical protein
MGSKVRMTGRLVAAARALTGVGREDFANSSRNSGRNHSFDGIKRQRVA